MSEVKVINAVYDAVSDTTVNIAAGTIERIMIKRINEDGSPRVTTFKDKNTGQQKSINNTHRYAVLLKEGEDQAWISFGEGEVKNLKYENQFQIKNPEGGYTDLKEGMKIRLPVVIKTYTKEDGSQGSSTEGKKARIKITDASGAREPRQKQQQSSGSQQQQKPSGGAAKKIYGDITSIEGNKVVVKLEDGTEVTVNLTDEQAGQITEGGRIAGVRSDDGTVTGFKAYGPKGASTGTGSRSGKGKDDLPIRLGNALSITDAMFPDETIANQGVIVEQVLAAMDSIKAKLREEFKSMDDYSFGARLGQCGILSARWGRDNIETFIAKTEENFRFICQLEDKIRNGASTPKQEEKKPEPEPQLTPSAEDSPTPDIEGHVNMSVDDMDFDDDIPF
ncbi:hypothetical protein A71_136 [Escherichia phage A7_1]|nr:hypothetical protein A71_136 [Escherichia phage A7_1]